MNVNGRTLYNRGAQAFRDYAPVTWSRRDGLYRTVRWGRNLELFFLDERSFRSANADANHVCDNPDTGSPDLAPTAPQTTRNLFALVTRRWRSRCPRPAWTRSAARTERSSASGSSRASCAT